MSESVTIRPVQRDGQTVTVIVDDIEHALHAIWLRDACTCPICRNPITNERLVDSTTIPLDVTVRAARIDSGSLATELSDGHTATCDLGWLAAHLRCIDQSGDPAAGRELWDGATDHAIPRFDRADLDDSAGLCAWLDAITACGAAMLGGVDPTDAGLRDVARLIGDIRATNYGVTWTIEATVEPVTAVESERPLAVHTDLPYRDVAPGIQLLLAAITDVDGGATTLVDGYAAAERIRATDPTAWRLLTTVEFAYPFVRDDVEFHGRAPLIGLHADGTYFQIRRAPDLAGVPFVEADRTPELYRALRYWADLLDDPTHHTTVSLRPGELLAFDNHRLLHGRTAFELGSEGRRLLHGCYLDVEDLRSRRAVAGRSL